MPSSECEARAEDKVHSPRASFLSDFVGLWLGDTEDALGDVDEHGALPIYSFASGSTRIRLEVSRADDVAATLTFGADARSPPVPRSTARQSGAHGALPPAEGFAYAAVPVARALDVERAAEAGGELEVSRGGRPSPGQVALDGKLVLAFAIEDRSVAELHLRFAEDGLIGVFDGLSLINERGFETRPGSVRFRRVADDGTGGR